MQSELPVQSRRRFVEGIAPDSLVVDLIILVDTSGSMGDEAMDLSDAADVAIKAAQESCPSDLRVCWFGIEGTWHNTRLIKPYRDYLHGQVTANAKDCSQGGTLFADANIRIYIADREKGAAAIMT